MSGFATTPAAASAPAPTMERADTSASVKTYHQNLASHLMSMIRQVGSDTINPKADLSDPSIPDPPPNPRQHSNSSLESESKISSGVTTETLPSSLGDTPDIIIENSPVDLTKGVSRLAISRQNSDPASPSARHDLTARPTLCPPKFSPGPHAPSANGAGTAAVPSPQSSPSHASPRLSPLSKPSMNKATRLEVDTREQEHRRAWEAEGRRVWRHIPHGFELKLQPKKRTGSHGSSVSGPASVLSGPSGAGPGNAIRADEEPVAVQEATSELDRVTSNNPTQQESESEASRPEVPPSASVSVAKPRHKRPSTLQQRQDKLEAGHQSDQAYSTEEARRGRSREPTSHSQDEQTLYNERKAARLARTEERLRASVTAWYSGVQAQWSPDPSSAPPEILPHCPSPGLAMSQLRFLPLDNSSDLGMPEWLKPKPQTPTLKLPPLHIVSESKRTRLHLIDERHVESDVDLLIRLSDINRIHAANTYDRTQGSYHLSPVLPLTRDERERDRSSDDLRVHSMNVRTTMTTPKPKQHAQLTRANE